MTQNTIRLQLQDESETFTIPESLNQTTVLYFMRAAICPQCNRHAREIDAALPELAQRGMGAIVIVPEDTQAAQKVKERNHLSLPVMASNGDAHALVGLEKKLLGLIQQSGTVVVNKAGEVLYKRIATNPEGSFDSSEFETFLASQPIVA